MLTIMKASAGSGKTYSLARTYIGLLLESNDKYAYRHILAVTFTNKATDEMKNRILKELHIMATDPMKSNYRKDFVPSLFETEKDMQKKAKSVLRDILHDYSSFAISTIDRFFQHTLKAFAREIGQFSSYQVELDKNSLVAESVDRMLDSLTEESGSLLSWLTQNVLEQIEQGGKYSLDANLLKMALRLTSSQRQEVMQKAGMNSEEQSSLSKLMDIRDVCRKIMAEFREKVKDAASAVVQVMKDNKVDLADTNRGFLSVLNTYLEIGQNDIIPMPRPTFFAKAQTPDLWFSAAKSKKFLHLVEASLPGPLNEFCQLWAREYAVYNTARILDSQIYGLGVAGELKKTFEELMKEKNVLCIEESNTILSQIIKGSDAPFIYERIGTRYDHFLLDEFQDTAQVQWTNFLPLLINSHSQGGKNLIVGDVKQSIYRWRGSDWKLLDKEIPEQFPGYKSDPLKENYRSFPNVVRFNNGFFKEAAFQLDCLTGDEGEDSVSRIYSDVDQKIAKEGTPDGHVGLTFCDKDDELEQILNAVQRAVDNGARYSDIAILIRSNALGEEVAANLMSKGIPVITDDSLKVKGSIMVRRVVSLLSYIDNPKDTVNSFLAESLNVKIPESCSSLVDMVESIIRCLKESGEFYSGEVLHLQSFMDALQDYVSLNGNSLRGFLKHWENVNPSISSPSSGNSVRIMTIHKSKGLAFPYVILPFVENITLYKVDSQWCVPDLAGTSLSGVAEGVYDVMLSSNSEATLFARHYKEERFLQQVDNINTLYVAMTRPAFGLDIIAQKPSEKFLKADTLEFSDFSQLLYFYARKIHLPLQEDQKTVCFRYGTMVNFNDVRESDKEAVDIFPITEGEEYPSIALNIDVDEGAVHERGRLKFSADSLDFFLEDGHAGGMTSKRLKGVILHDVLSRVVSEDDVETSVRMAVNSGELSEDEYDDAMNLLSERLADVRDRGWFSPGDGYVLNEASVMNSDGRIYRPDRVVVKGNNVEIIDYKFGEPDQRYHRKMMLYAQMWKNMGDYDVSAFLWYVTSGEVVKVV